MKYQNIKGKNKATAIDPCDMQSAYSQGVRYIGISTKCSKDVCKHLCLKGYNSNTIHIAIEQIVQDGYINERLYTKKKIDELLILKPVSTKRIKIILLEKGIDCNTIEDVLSGYDIDDLKIARQILADRYGSIVSALNSINIKKAQSLLKYRGFTFGVIKELIEKTGV